MDNLQILIKDIPKYYLQGLYTNKTLEVFVSCGYITKEFRDELIRLKILKLE